MYINLVFFGYMAAVFLGFSGIIVMLLAASTKAFEKSKQYYLVTLFTISAFSYSALYFIFYYRENVLNQYELGIPWRMADYILGCALMFLWIFVMESFNGQNGKRRRFCRAVVLMMGARALFSCVMAVCFMDGYYYIKNQDSLMPTIEIFFILLTAVFMACSYYQAIKQIPLSLARCYITVVSAALILMDLSQSIVNYYLYSGRFGISAWNLETFDPTGPIFILINLSTLVFIFKTDFTPIYIAKESLQETAHRDKEEPGNLLDVTAEKHNLTRREREVIQLVYEGFSNPDIAELLCISRNTVKQHIHNIFEKLDVATRIELIHLINAQEVIAKNSD